MDSPVLFISELGKQKNADPVPLVLFGHLGASVATLISKYSTMNCLTVTGLDLLESELRERPCAALYAMSRTTAPGEAGEAIRAFHRANGSKAALYGAWDYNLAKASKLAIEYEADGIVMPGTETNEMFGCIFGTLARVQNGEARPRNREEHEELLRRFAPKSPFWQLQDRILSPYY